MKGDWQFFEIITSPVWLKAARPYFLAALPQFIIPAALFTIASIGIHCANTFAFAQFTEKEIGLPNLLVAFAVFLGVFVIGTPVLFYAVVRWMFSITAFTQYWLDGPLSETTSPAIEARKQKASKIVKGRQKYLTAYWLYCGIFTVTPALFAIAFLTTKAYSVWQPTSVPANLVVLIDYLFLPLGCLLGAFSLVASFVSIPLAVSKVATSEVDLVGVGVSGHSVTGAALFGDSVTGGFVSNVSGSNDSVFAESASAHSASGFAELRVSESERSKSEHSVSHAPVSKAIVSETSDRRANSAKEAAWRAFQLSFKFFPQALICALILGATHTIVDNPELLYRPGGWQTVLSPETNPVRLVLSELWQGLTSVIFVPLSVVPLCEMLRSVVDESDQFNQP